MISLGTMLKQLAGMVGTTDLSAWENGFVTDTLARTDEGKRTSLLSAKQVEKIEQLWSKHFG